MKKCCGSKIFILGKYTPLGGVSDGTQVPGQATLGGVSSLNLILGVHFDTVTIIILKVDNTDNVVICTGYSGLDRDQFHGVIRLLNRPRDR